MRCDRRSFVTLRETAHYELIGDDKMNTPTTDQMERVITLINAISDLNRGDLLTVFGLPQVRMCPEFARHLETQLAQLMSFREKLPST
jgi:hypothetical protein